MATKNVGALAILMPVAHPAVADAPAPRARRLLMPMSFLSLLGGLVTLVGTSTNIIVSQVREQTLGKPFQMFDFAPVGLVLTALGLVFVSFGWRLLPKDRPGQSPTWARRCRPPPTPPRRALPDDWPAARRASADLKLGGDGVKVTALVSGGRTPRKPRANRRLQARRRAVLEGDAGSPERRLSPHAAGSTLRAGKDVGEGRTARRRCARSRRWCGADSVLDRALGRRALQLQQQFGVKLLAVSRSGARVTERLRRADAARRRRAGAAGGRDGLCQAPCRRWAPCRWSTARCSWAAPAGGSCRSLILAGAMVLRGAEDAAGGRSPSSPRRC